MGGAKLGGGGGVLSESQSSPAESLDVGLANPKDFVKGGWVRWRGSGGGETGIPA